MPHNTPDETTVSGPEGQSFTTWLKTDAGDEWTEATNHAFTNALAAGQLPEETYATYLLQDYAFLDALVGTFGHAVAEAPGIETKRPLIEFLGTLTDDENDYFERAFEALSIPSEQWHNPKPNEVTASFIELLGRAAHSGGFEETLAVLVPAEWIYLTWASAAADPDPPNNPSADLPTLPFYYAEWIELHAHPNFKEFVEWLRSHLDLAGPRLHPRRQQRIRNLFRRTVHLEKRFFDVAYTGTR